MAQAAKRAGRATTEGLVGYRIENGVGTMVAVGCETEPVSNNEEFQAFAKSVFEAVHAGGRECVESLEDDRVAVSAKLGENIAVVGAERYGAGGRGLSATPIRLRTRSACSSSSGQRGAGPAAGDAHRLRRTGVDDEEEAPAELVEAERQVYLNSDELAGKPEQAKEKIVEGNAPRRPSRRSRAAPSPSSRGFTIFGRPWARRSRRRRSTCRRFQAAVCRRIALWQPTRNWRSKRLPADPAFRRILLKLSGEALMAHEFGTDPRTVAADRRGDRRSAGRGHPARDRRRRRQHLSRHGRRRRGNLTGRRRTTRACSRPS